MPALFDPVYDDYTAVLSVVATLLIVQLDTYNAVDCDTVPEGIGIASWWLRNVAFYGMFATLITSVAASYAEIGHGRRNSLFVPTALLGLSTLCYLVDRELQSIISFSGLRRKPSLAVEEWTEEGFDSETMVPPPVGPSVRGAFYAGELVPLNLFLLLCPFVIWYMMRAGDPYQEAATEPPVQREARGEFGKRGGRETRVGSAHSAQSALCAAVQLPPVLLGKREYPC